MTDVESDSPPNNDPTPAWIIAVFAVFMTLAWPLLLGNRGAPFEGFHRRELVMIAVGMAVWGAVGWFVHPPAFGGVLPEVVM